MASRILRWLRSALFAAIFYTMTVFFVSAAWVAALFSDAALRRVVSGWGRFHRRACHIILGQKVQIIGDLPQEPILYIFKHESMFETIDLLCLFDHPVVVAKQELIDIPFWGAIAKRHGVIGLRREDGAKAVRHLKAEAIKAVQSGRPICLFPEGTRVPHGEMPSIKAGFAAVYHLLGLAVVPVAVNSGLVSPRNSFVKSPGTISYKVGEVIPAGLPRKEAEARVHAAINALNG